MFGYFRISFGFEYYLYGFGYPMSPNSRTVRYFATSDRIQIRVWVSDKMSNPNKSYEYEVSLIYIHIIYIY